MRYKKSLARVSLERSHAEIVKRLRLSDKNNVDPDVREYVVSAAIFLAHSMIENYISDLFTSFARCAEASCANAAALPPFLRSHLFIHKTNAWVTFANFVATRSEKDVIRSFSESITGTSSGFVDNLLATPKFDGKDIFTSNKYPSEKNLRKIFFRVGVTDIFVELNKVLKGDSVILLESLGSLRTSLAHNGSLPGISAKDARDRMGDAGKFINAMDRVMYRTACSGFSQAAWVKYGC